MTAKRLILQVARGRIELSTRGFSVFLLIVPEYSFIILKHRFHAGLRRFQRVQLFLVFLHFAPFFLGRLHRNYTKN